MTQHFDRALAAVGIRSTQFTILSALALAGWVTTNDLAHGLVMDRTTLTRNLKLLRTDGLIEARPAQGSRQIQFGLSDPGRDLLARAIPRWRDAQDGIVQAFGDTQWPGMVQELGRLVKGTLALGSDTEALAGAGAARRGVQAIGAPSRSG
ncbi:MAG: winged helix-turn-helix transcriptional regulator [Chloroflexi bacterium]|nr:winged helix-turn-helix transcriptional regulator [Chloroflexota bacterium]